MDTNMPREGLVRGRGRRNYRERGRNAGDNQFEGLAAGKRFDPGRNTGGRGRGGRVSGGRVVGGRGRGPWQNMELDAFIREFVRRECPVIPVILNDCKNVPNLPIFLQGMTWVDFRQQDPDPMALLIWGITGERVKVAL